MILIRLVLPNHGRMVDMISTKGSKSKYILIFFIGIIFLSSCNKKTDYCDSLLPIMNSSDQKTHLEVWVASNIVGNLIKFEDVLGGGGMWPGKYFLKNPKFDWKVLGFKSDSQIRLVGSITENMNGYLEGITSVYFGERSRQGLLVKLPESASFGVEKDFIISASKNIAVICR